MKRDDREKTIFRILPDGEPITVKGRDSWALRELVKAGERGCTPITHPGPRWSGYILKLRKAGVAIETIHEKHGGSYAGVHGKYRLVSEVDVISHTPAPEAGGHA